MHISGILPYYWCTSRYQDSLKYNSPNDNPILFVSPIASLDQKYQAERIVYENFNKIFSIRFFFYSIGSTILHNFIKSFLVVFARKSQWTIIIHVDWVHFLVIHWFGNNKIIGSIKFRISWNFIFYTRIIRIRDIFISQVTKHISLAWIFKSEAKSIMKNNHLQLIEQWSKFLQWYL